MGKLLGQVPLYTVHSHKNMANMPFLYNDCILNMATVQHVAAKDRRLISCTPKSRNNDECSDSLKLNLVDSDRYRHERASIKHKSSNTSTGRQLVDQSTDDGSD